MLLNGLYKHLITIIYLFVVYLRHCVYLYFWDNGFSFIGPPLCGNGTYEFTRVRSFVLPSRSQNPFIGLFWFLAQSCSIISIRKWHFRFFPKKSRFRHSGAKTVKNSPFWPKNVHFDQFLQFQSWDFSDFSHINSVFGLKKNGQKKFLPKNINFPFLAQKGQKIAILAQKLTFRPISPNHFIRFC